jgi:hypothetical protein
VCIQTLPRSRGEEQEKGKTPAGKKEFTGRKCTFPELNQEKWALMKGLRMCLRSFDEATAYLSGDQYFTYVSALPMLRKVKAFLNNSLLFDFCTSSKFKDSFKQDYGQESFFDSVVIQLNECRLFLAEQFSSRFTGLDSSLMWSSLFDPCFASCEHMIGLEKLKAFQQTFNVRKDCFERQQTWRLDQNVEQ